MHLYCRKHHRCNRQNTHRHQALYGAPDTPACTGAGLRRRRPQLMLMAAEPQPAALSPALHGAMVSVQGKSNRPVTERCNRMHFDGRVMKTQLCCLQNVQWTKMEYPDRMHTTQHSSCRAENQLAFEPPPTTHPCHVDPQSSGNITSTPKCPWSRAPPPAAAAGLLTA